jgi:hypothetical protein
MKNYFKQQQAICINQLISKYYLEQVFLIFVFVVDFPFVKQAYLPGNGESQPIAICASAYAAETPEQHFTIQTFVNACIGDCLSHVVQQNKYFSDRGSIPEASVELSTIRGETIFIIFIFYFHHHFSYQNHLYS